jgi:AraC-like DNA-binding protein
MLSLFETFMYAGNLAMTVFGVFREEMTLVPVLARSFQFTIVLMMISLVVISYYMLFRPELLYGTGFQTSKETESASLPVSPSEPQVVVQPKTEYCEKLEAYLAEQKPFLRKRLTLSDLSAELDLPSYILSGLLNNHYRQNFNDFINDYRIAYVKERMKSGSEWKSLSMEGLALESGFSSRTAFYTAFKKRMNMSPGAYAASLEGK